MIYQQKSERMSDFNVNLITRLESYVRAAPSNAQFLSQILQDDSLATSMYANLGLTLKVLIPHVNLHDHNELLQFANNFIFSIIRRGHAASDLATPLVKLATAMVSIELKSEPFYLIWSTICDKLGQVDRVLNDIGTAQVNQETHKLLDDLFRNKPEYSAWLIPWAKSESRKNGFEQYYQSYLTEILPDSTMQLGQVLNLDVLGLLALNDKLKHTPDDKAVALGFNIE